MISRYLLSKLGFCGLMKTLIEKAMKITCLCRLMKTTITQMMTAMQRTATTAPTIAPVDDVVDGVSNTISIKPVPRHEQKSQDSVWTLILMETSNSDSKQTNTPCCVYFKDKIMQQPVLFFINHGSFPLKYALFKSNTKEKSDFLFCVYFYSSWRLSILSWAWIPTILH